MSVKDNRVDVRDHMNTEAKERFNFGCNRRYMKLESVLIVREIRKKWGAYRHQGYFLRTLDDMEYKAKYQMEC